MLAAIVGTLAIVTAMLSIQAIAPTDRAEAASALLCDQNTLYGIDSNGRTVAINVTTGATTSLTNMSPAFNGIGVTDNGVDAWAYDGSDQRITRYSSATGSVTTFNNVDSNAPGTIIRGALNPATGVYYYGGSGTSAYLGAFNTVAGTPIGRIGSITGLADGNGDFAFSTGGLMFVVAGNAVVRVNNPTLPTTSGNVSLATSLVATLPSGTNSPGIAFSTDGFLYVSNGSSVFKLDPASGANLGTFNIEGGFSPTDLASCNYPNTVSVQKNVTERLNPTDQFGLSVTGGQLTSGNTATTSGTTDGVQIATAGAALAIPDRVYTVAETAAGTTSLSNYTATWSCVNVNNSAVVATGTGTSGSFTFPSAASADGTDVVCTFTNTPKTATLTLSKALGTPRSSDADQFTMAVHSGSASGPVLNSTASSTTTGTGSTVTAGTGTTGVTTVVATRPYVLSEAMAPGSGSQPAQYRARITCVDANGLQSGLPVDAAYSGALSVTPVAGAAISCLVSNGTVPPTISLSAELGSPRYGNGDQFTVGIHSDSASGPIVSPLGGATTAGSGSTVAGGTGTTGDITVTAGATYYLAESTSVHGDKYDATITCTDANGYQSGLPVDAPFTGSLAITPVAGAQIQCMVTNVLAPASLSLAKSNPAALTVGVASNYTLTVTNDGGEPAASATVADLLPANLRFDGADGADCTADGQLITCDADGPIAGGDSVSFTVTVTPTDAAAGTSVVNRAAVDPTGGTEPGNPGECTATGTPEGCAITPELQVGNGVDLSLAKQNPASLVVGVPADYTLTVTNNGTGPAASATVADLLPENLTYNSATGAACTYAGQLITCQIPGPIAPGASASFTINMTPTAAAAGTSVANAAAVDPTGGEEPADPGDCTADDAPDGCAVTPELPVGNGVDLSLAKTNPASLVVGVASAYTLTVTNNGTGPAASATVADVLPENLRFDGATGAECSAEGQLLTCTVPGPIAPGGGAASFTMTVTPLAAAADSSVANAAAVDPTGGEEPADPEECEGEDAPAGCAVTPELPVGNGVDLSLAKQNPASLVVGVASDYTLTVTNNGTGPAASATVTDLLPENLSFDGATGAECSAEGQLLTCEVPGPIAPDGGAASFTVTVTPLAAAADASVVNAAAVDPTGGEEPADPEECEGEDAPAGCAVTPELPVGNGVDLSIAKTNPVSLTVDVAAEYTLTVTNNGTGPAASATVSDLLPEGLLFNASVGADCAADGDLLTCTVPGVIEAGGGTAIFTISVTPTAEAEGSAISNRATVDATSGTDPGDPAACDTEAPSDTCAVTPPMTVVTASLLLEKHAEPVAPATVPVKVGDEVGYSFFVTNTSEVSVDKLTVDDPMLDEITCDVTTLAPGESTSCVGNPVTITQIDLDAGSLVNTATASARLPGCLEREGQDCPVMVTSPASSATIPTDSVGSLTAVKTAELDDANKDGRANSGEQIRYTVVATNSGTVTLESLAVDDPLVQLECATSTLAPDESADCTGLYTVTQPDEAAGRVLNVATAHADGPQGQVVESGQASVTVEAGERPRTLPGTGADPALAGGLALMLLLLGAGLTMLVTHRRRRG